MGCLSYGTFTICATASKKEPLTGASRTSKHISMDILHPLAAVGLTPSTTCAFYLILIDAHSCYIFIYGMSNNTTTAVITAIQQNQADHRRAGTYGYLDMSIYWLTLIVTLLLISCANTAISLAYT